MKISIVLTVVLCVASSLAVLEDKAETITCVITTDRQAPPAESEHAVKEVMHAEDGLFSVGNTLATITCKNSTFSLASNLKCDPKFTEINIVVDEGKPKSKTTKITAPAGHNEVSKNDLVRNLKNITAENSLCQFNIGSAGLFGVFTAFVAVFVALF